MPVPFLIALAGILFVSVAVAMAFWEKILNWAMESLFPWLEKNLPQMEKYVREAFVVLDSALVPVKKGIKEAWEKLREYLLKQTIELQHKSPQEWVKKVTSWIIVKIESGRPVVKKIETVEEVSYDSLPEDIRRELIVKQKKQRDINVTEMRDKQIEEILV